MIIAFDWFDENDLKLGTRMNIDKRLQEMS